MQWSGYNFHCIIRTSNWSHKMTNKINLSLCHPELKLVQMTFHLCTSNWEATEKNLRPPLKCYNDKIRSYKNCCKAKWYGCYYKLLSSRRCESPDTTLRSAWTQFLVQIEPITAFPAAVWANCSTFISGSGFCSQKILIAWQNPTWIYSQCGKRND